MEKNGNPLEEVDTHRRIFFYYLDINLFVPILKLKIEKSTTPTITIDFHFIISNIFLMPTTANKYEETTILLFIKTQK